MWLMKTLLTSRCINQRGAGHIRTYDGELPSGITKTSLSGIFGVINTLAAVIIVAANVMLLQEGTS